MNRYTFHLEYATAKDRRNATRKNLGNHTGNVIAKLPARPWGLNNYDSDTVRTTTGLKNGRCYQMPTKDQYLKTYTLRISEKVAREIHPNLFTYLDSTK